MSKPKNKKEFVFRLNTYSIETMPMNRLVEYISDLAAAMGEHKNVHLEGIESGSVAIKVLVDNDVEPHIRERLRLLGRNEGPPEIRRALHRINRRLAEDDATATLVDQRKKNVVQFPGAKRSATIGPIKQRGTLDGTPIRIGGKGQNVPVHIDRFGHEIYVCGARREIAQRIAQHMFATPIRVEGVGTWRRWPDGIWDMDSFTIHDFDILKEISIQETVQQLRAIDLPVLSDEGILGAVAKVRNGH